MKTAVASTSIDCYRAIHGEGKLSRQQSQIMGVIYAGQDYSLQELVKLTGMPINAVSGRCNELRTARRLEHGRTRPCSVTGRMVHPVKLPSIQDALF
jgi:hypothetical protein